MRRSPQESRERRRLADWALTGIWLLVAFVNIAIGADPAYVMGALLGTLITVRTMR